MKKLVSLLLALCLVCLSTAALAAGADITGDWYGTMYGMGVKDVIEKILPVVYNFERGFSQVTEEDKDDAFVHGMEAIYKQFVTVLDGLGVKPIEAVGQTFDPAFHNAVMHVDDETVGENIIVEEFQKGYMYHDTVVRFSMVKVAN